MIWIFIYDEVEYHYVSTSNVYIHHLIYVSDAYKR